MAERRVITIVYGEKGVEVYVKTPAAEKRRIVYSSRDSQKLPAEIALFLNYSVVEIIEL